MTRGTFPSVSPGISGGEPAIARAFEVPSSAPPLAGRIAEAIRPMVLWFRSVLAEAEELERQGAWPRSNGLSDWEVIDQVRAIFPADGETPR
jgi:hypothetical protein